MNIIKIFPRTFMMIICIIGAIISIVLGKYDALTFGIGILVGTLCSDIMYESGLVNYE